MGSKIPSCISLVFLIVIAHLFQCEGLPVEDKCKESNVYCMYVPKDCAAGTSKCEGFAYVDYTVNNQVTFALKTIIDPTKKCAVLTFSQHNAITTNDVGIVRAGGTKEGAKVIGKFDTSAKTPTFTLEPTDKNAVSIVDETDDTIIFQLKADVKGDSDTISLDNTYYLSLSSGDYTAGDPTAATPETCSNDIVGAGITEQRPFIINSAGRTTVAGLSIVIALLSIYLR